jgi:hypothetical protein
MNSWPPVNDKLDRFLGNEPELEGKYLRSEPLRIDGWNWAQKMLTAHTPMEKTMVLELEEDGRTAVLPTDFVRAYRIYDSGEERWWWPKRHWRPGDYRPDDDDSLMYWMWGGRLYFEYELNVDQTEVVLYYQAYYPDVEYEVEDDGELTLTQPSIYTPAWAEVPLMHLTAAHVLQPMEIASSNLNQYKIRVESGHPEHNPRAQSALFHLRWYETLLGWFAPSVEASVDPTR